MTATTLTITRRSRIGFAWTNSPERWTDRNGQSHLRISSPGDMPRETGYPRAVYAEYQRAARLNNANDWARCWFVRHDGQWVKVNLDPLDLWSLLENDPSCPTNAIEVDVIERAQ